MKGAVAIITVFCSLSVTFSSTASFVVPSVTALGNPTDSVAKIWPNRDGRSEGTINGKIVWFYSDTDYTKDGKLYGFYGNTGAIGEHNNPLVVIGPAKEAIPFTAVENAYNTEHKFNPTVVLWPKSGPVEVSTGRALFWVPKGYYGSGSDQRPDPGIVIREVTLAANDSIIVTRLSDGVFWNDSQPAFGNMASTKDDRIASQKRYFFDIH